MNEFIVPESVDDFDELCLKQAAIDLESESFKEDQRTPVCFEVPSC